MTLDKERDLKTPKTETSRGLVTVKHLIFKEDLGIYQGLANRFTNAGFGPFSYKVSEEQICPGLDKPLENPNFVVVTFSGARNRERLLHAICDIKDVRKRMERKELPKEEIAQKIDLAMEDVVDLELLREKADRKFDEANLLGANANNKRLLGIQYYVPGEEWRTDETFSSASRLQKRSDELLEEVGELNQRQHSLRKKLVQY